MATTATRYDRATQNIGNMVSLDHVNLTIADQATATLFYIVGLGLTRDPYLTVELRNMWINAGRQQFHLPTSESSQVVRGSVGLVVPDLDGLEGRLKGLAPRLKSTAFAFMRDGGQLEVTCPWGNRFRCQSPDGAIAGARLGIRHIEFSVPSGSAQGIARFYRTMLEAPADVQRRNGADAAVVQAGRGQWLIFREDESESRSYDGHHIAVYLANFSRPHAALSANGLVTEESNEHQYRFVDIVDPENGDLLYQLEHEVRSMFHPMYQRPLVNRNPDITNAGYTPGTDSFMVG